MIQTFQISGLGSQVVYRPVDIIGSEIPHWLEYLFPSLTGWRYIPLQALLIDLLISNNFSCMKFFCAMHILRVIIGSQLDRPKIVKCKIHAIWTSECLVIIERNAHYESGNDIYLSL